MTDTFIALGFAIFIWWFSTGVVILLNRMSRTAVTLSLVISSALCVGALAGLSHTAQQTGVLGAYCAFTCALLAWGWNELSFLTGWITGPQKTAILKSTTGWPRFVASFNAVVWHELAILAVGLAIFAITWDAPNQVGAGTYLVLWIMRTSAKLNLFLGVRNLSEEFLPVHLAYLESFFKRRRMNAFFPFAVVTATACLWLLVDYSNQPLATPAQVVGAVLVGTLLALAIVEHLMLVLPVDTTALWRWAIRRNQKSNHLESHDKSLQVN
ncbi:putative photosynthetic complex assembly protein PuhE [Limnohabitans sp.]|uniref:putative photosynthetic complex assembly protein PuhE n=1 Tax=Limnohabitans sp. TaxID=1907725 RepID=UPI002FDEDF85